MDAPPRKGGILIALLIPAFNLMIVIVEPIKFLQEFSVVQELIINTDAKSYSRIVNSHLGI